MAAFGGTAASMVFAAVARVAVALCRSQRLILPSEFRLVTEKFFEAKVCLAVVPMALCLERALYFFHTERLRTRIAHPVRYLHLGDGVFVNVMELDPLLLNAMEAAQSSFLPLTYLRLYQARTRDTLMTTVESPADPRLLDRTLEPFRRRTLQRDVEDRAMLRRIQVAYEQIVTPSLRR